MFNRGKLLSGVVAIGIYLFLIFVVLYYYNIHSQKAKNYVEKNSNRVTVTLVNSDKTVLNRSDKINTPNKPVPEAKAAPITPAPPPPAPKKTVVKEPDPKVVARRQEEQRRQAAEREKKRQAQVARENRRQEQERQKELTNKKLAEERRIARLEANKKKREEARQREESKRREQERRRLAEQEAKKKKETKEAKRRQEQERQRLAALEAKKKKEAEARRQREEKEKKRRQAQDLFANIDAKDPVKRTPQSNSQPNRVKHTSTATDRIRNTHQSGQVSDKNRERGVENAYIAKVKRQLNNWSAQSNYKGNRATIRLTISSSGHFRYSIQSSTSGAMSSGLREFLDQLNRMGLGSHSKSTPYVISVNFIAR